MEHPPAAYVQHSSLSSQGGYSNYVFGPMLDTHGQHPPGYCPQYMPTVHMTNPRSRKNDKRAVQVD